MRVESLDATRVEAVVARIAAQQRAVAAAHPLIAGDVDTATTRTSFLAGSPCAVAVRGDAVVGHLRGAVLESQAWGRSAWIGPGDVSFDDADVLDALYVARADDWIASGVRRHYVWVPDGDEGPWLALGFAYMHVRGVRALADDDPPALPSGYELRRGSLDDLDTALALDEELRLFQEAGPSYALGLADTGQREEWAETLEDPDTDYVLVTHDGEPVAQASTFPLPTRLGTFPQTVHLSAVTVREAHRGRGVGRALVGELLTSAARHGARYCETNWRVTNRVAARHWERAGFTRTYVRLHRAIGVG